MASTKGSNRAVMVFGLLTVAMYLTAIALLPMDAPDSASSGEEIVAYASAHRSQLLASYLIFAMGLAVLLVFAAGLYRIIRRAEPEDGWLAMARSRARSAAQGSSAPASRCSWSLPTGRPLIRPWFARSGMPAGSAYNIAGFGFVAWIAIITIATLRHGALPEVVGLGRHSGGRRSTSSARSPSKQGTARSRRKAGTPWSSALTFAVWLLVIAIAAGRPTRSTLM